MKNKLIIILIIFSNTILAQEEIAKEILDKLSEITKSYKNISIEFDFIFENNTKGIKKVEEGIIILEKEKFKLTMEDQIIINNGTTQWIYLSDMNEVQIMDHDPEDNTMSPNKLFSIYEEEYKYTYIGNNSDKEKHLQIIELFPKDSGEFMKINLSINAKENRLERATIYDKNGGTYTYLVKTFRTNTVIKPLIFNITEFPGIEIIDLR